MKKKEYQAPEMEIVELKFKQSLLTVSTGESSETIVPEEPGGHQPNF